MFEIAGGIVLGLLLFTLIIANLERIIVFGALIVALAVVVTVAYLVWAFVDLSEIAYTAIGIGIAAAILVPPYFIIKRIQASDYWKTLPEKSRARNLSDRLIRYCFYCGISGALMLSTMQFLPPVGFVGATLFFIALCVAFVAFFIFLTDSIGRSIGYLNWLMRAKQ